MTGRTSDEKMKKKVAVTRVAARLPERSCRAGAARGDDEARAALTPSSLLRFVSETAAEILASVFARQSTTREP
jgi:hypothetical protein